MVGWLASGEVSLVKVLASGVRKAIVAMNGLRDRGVDNISGKGKLGILIQDEIDARFFPSFLVIVL